MDDIEKAQYANLRRCVTDNLIEPILGKDYYNYGMDVYTCDEVTTLDILEHFYHERFKTLVYKALTIVGFSGWLIYILATHL